MNVVIKGEFEGEKLQEDDFEGDNFKENYSEEDFEE